MDVARGLDKMHSRHIIHLDLKSPNILLTAGGTAKIAVSHDYSLSRSITVQSSAFGRTAVTADDCAPACP
jgi:serine/threonine protein kinase